MTKIHYKDIDGQVQEIKIPDTLTLTLLMGVIGGVGGAVLGFVAGLCTDAVSMFKGWN